MRSYRFVTICIVSVFAPYAFPQTTPASNQNPPANGAANRASSAQPGTSSEQLPKRLFWVIPNHRSSGSLADAKPLTAKQKFNISVRDAFDPGNMFLAGALAGIAQANDSLPSYGQGMAGYGQYFGATYGDNLIGRVMSVGVYPSLFHQDPRYYRRRTGSVWSRLEYAVSQVILTHGDDKSVQFNYSEFCGRASGVAISNAYNFDKRSAGDAAGKLGFQIGFDMLGNVIKEFGPDLGHKFHAGGSTKSGAASH
jgi:hypothetical protein